jgi:DNA-binding XRE family transcriptional regulator
MRKSKRKRLEANGWKIGSSREFLQLSDVEAAFIEMKLALSQGLRERRVREGLSQADFATRIQSSQSRVAKMEGGDPSVSIDLLVRSLLALGASREEVADSIRRAAA